MSLELSGHVRYRKREPGNLPYHFHVTLHPAVHSKCKQTAKAKNMSLSRWVAELMEKASGIQVQQK
jgi:hypothetical protein